MKEIVFAETAAFEIVSVTKAPFLTALTERERLLFSSVGNMFASVIINVVSLRAIDEIVLSNALLKSVLLIACAVCLLAVYVTPLPTIEPESVIEEPAGKA